MGLKTKQERVLKEGLQAFTVIELLVVIAIISVLAALLFPAVKKARNAAASAQCIGKMRLLGISAKSYIGDNNGLLPYSSDNSAWIYNLAPYLDIVPTKKTGNDPTTDIFLCPADPSRAPKQRRTYRYHQSFPSPAGASAYGRNNYVPSRVTEILRPSTHAMLFCVAYTGPRALDLWRFDEAIWKEAPDIANPASESNNNPRPHYGGKAVNILYSDGHAAAAAYPLPPETWHFDGK